MNLYHISLNLEDEIQKFTPRLPTAVYEGEDSVTPRISVSTSIEGALSLVPFGGRKLEVTMSDLSDIHGNDEVLYVRVYVFDSEKIKEGNLIDTNTLWLQGLVPDAEVGDEYWIVNQEIIPLSSYIIEITSFIETVHDVFDPIVAKEEIPNEDYYDYLVCSPTKIVGLEYNEYPTLNDLPVDIDMLMYNRLLFKMRVNDFEGL